MELQRQDAQVQVRHFASDHQRAQRKIGKQRLLLVARKHDADVSDKHDENIAMRLLPAVERNGARYRTDGGKAGLLQQAEEGRHNQRLSVRRSGGVRRVEMRHHEGP
jgi:hypothetical protein